MRNSTFILQLILYNIKIFIGKITKLYYFNNKTNFVRLPLKNLTSNIQWEPSCFNKSDGTINWLERRDVYDMFVICQLLWRQKGKELRLLIKQHFDC